MGFSDEWDSQYATIAHLSISDLVSYVMRYARPTGPDFRVLELGPGAGANIPFFKHLTADYHAIDGSPTIVAALRTIFPEFSRNILAADFTSAINFDTPFDLIVDRAAITHNDTAAISKTLQMCLNILKPEGKFIGIDWFSTEHSDYRLGEEAGDYYTRRNIEEGQFHGIGNVHFSDREHLIKLFSGFRFEKLEHKIHKREVPQDNHVFASYNIIAVKAL